MSAGAKFLTISLAFLVSLLPSILGYLLVSRVSGVSDPTTGVGLLMTVMVLAGICQLATSLWWLIHAGRILLTAKEPTTAAETATPKSGDPQGPIPPSPTA